MGEILVLAQSCSCETNFLRAFTLESRPSAGEASLASRFLLTTF